MLRHRLCFGTLMFAALLAAFTLDNQLDRLVIGGTIWQQMFSGRSTLPPGLVMLGLWMALIALGARELSAIFRAKDLCCDARLLALGGMSGCALVYFMPHAKNAPHAMAIAGTLMTILLLAALLRASRGRQTEGTIGAASVMMFTVVYLGLLPGFFLAIRQTHTAWVVVALLVITKSSDIGAYAIGRLIGRHRLIPWLSPGKTWEGLIGGMALSGLVALILAAIFNRLQAGSADMNLAGIWRISDEGREFVAVAYPLAGAVLGGMLIGLAGQMGDLVASLLKRDAGVKDSGQTIPGFGGLLDVVDSPILVAPLAYWIMKLAAAPV